MPSHPRRRLTGLIDKLQHAGLQEATGNLDRCGCGGLLHERPRPAEVGPYDVEPGPCDLGDLRWFNINSYPASASQPAPRSTPACTCGSIPLPNGFRITATWIGFATAGPCRGAGTQHGSRASCPLRMVRASRRSATWRAIGPWQLRSWAEIGRTDGSVTAASAMRPRVGRSAKVPHICDGIRSEPPRSLPSPSGVIPVAKATASPPEEPPGVRFMAHGFRVWPPIPLSVCLRKA